MEGLIRTIVDTQSVDAEKESAFALGEEIADRCSTNTERNAAPNSVEHSASDNAAIRCCCPRADLGSDTYDCKDDVDNPSSVHIRERHDEHREDAAKENEYGRAIRSLLDSDMEVFGHQHVAWIDHRRAHLTDESEASNHDRDVHLPPVRPVEWIVRVVRRLGVQWNAIAIEFKRLFLFFTVP